eukprot:GDKI01029636.1.p1 GENE.GDKI01029636.1~~GDKI01029636.1.p1  ORF type:complete len:100 (+),score=30.38 GDKI01029636.1:52-351(+)
MWKSLCVFLCDFLRLCVGVFVCVICMFCPPYFSSPRVFYVHTRVFMSGVLCVCDEQNVGRMCEIVCAWLGVRVYTGVCACMRCNHACEQSANVCLRMCV